MMSNLSAASGFGNVQDNGYFSANESYALIPTAGSEHASFPQCMATDKPAFEELHNSFTEPRAYGFNLCELLRLVLHLMLLDLVLISVALILKISILMKTFFRQRYRNVIINLENEYDAGPVQPGPVPSREDSRRGKGDQQQNRGHRRQRRSLRSTLTSPSSESPSIPPAFNSLSSAPVVPVTALVACTRDISPCITSAATTQMTTSAASDSLPQDCSAESSDYRRSRIVGSDHPETEELDPCKFRSVGSHLNKLQHARKAAKQPDLDGFKGNCEEDDNIAGFSSVLDPASAQHHTDSDDSSEDSKAQPENHRTSKSAKKRTEIPVLVDTPCTARCGMKMEQQSSSNQRGSPRTKTPVFMMPHKLCDLGGNSSVIPEGKSNEGLSCGVECQLGDSELEVRRSGACNEATDVEEMPMRSKYGSILFENYWEHRMPVWQEKSEYMSMGGANCEALFALDALLEEEDDAVEMALDGKNPAIKARDLQLPTRQVMGRRM